MKRRFQYYQCIKCEGVFLLHIEKRNEIDRICCPYCKNDKDRSFLIGEGIEVNSKNLKMLLSFIE